MSYAFLYINLFSLAVLVKNGFFYCFGCVINRLGFPAAHRTPDKAAEFAKNAEANGIEVIICAAGMAAHLGGVIAAHTIVPVIGIPIKSTLDGMDALLATVQMPPGIPVATVGIDNGTNAAILAAQILSVKYDYLKDALKAAKVKMVEGVEKKNEKIKKLVEEL